MCKGVILFIKSYIFSLVERISVHHKALALFIKTSSLLNLLFIFSIQFSIEDKFLISNGIANVSTLYFFLLILLLYIYLLLLDHLWIFQL